MKTKRILPLLLALAMSLALTAPAFAATLYQNKTIVGGNEGIIPVAEVYPKDKISLSSGNSVGPFTTSPSSGRYLRIWFNNQGSEAVTVMLMDGSNSGEPLASMSAEVNGLSKSFTYTIPTPDVPHTYYIRFASPATGARIEGSVAAVLYQDEDTAGGSEGIKTPLYLSDTESGYAGLGSAYRTHAFTSAPGNGEYIKVWYANRSDHDTTVYLYRRDKPGYVASVTVKANSQTDNVIWYTGSDTEYVTYYVRVVSEDDCPPSGWLAVAQYISKPNPKQ